MPISLTCLCGARLEFDDAFAGKSIPCPDCQRPLDIVSASAAPVAPEVARPDQRTSNLAMGSLFLALAGAFTLLGSLAAAGMGWFALGRIDRSQGKLGGRKIARAGVVLGLCFTVITGVLLFLKQPFGIDGLFRVVEWAGALDYSTGQTVTHKTPKGNHPLSIVRPAGFGKVVLSDPNAVKRDDILLYSPYDDAYLVCLAHYPNNDEEIIDPTDRLKKAMESLEQSDMVRMIFERRVPEKTRSTDVRKKSEVPSFYRDKYTEDKQITHADTRWDICQFDVVLGGRLRTLLVYYTQVDSMLLIAAGAARAESFSRLKPTLESALQSILWQK